MSPEDEDFTTDEQVRDICMRIGQRATMTEVIIRDMSDLLKKRLVICETMAEVNDILVEFAAIQKKKNRPHPHL